jgi:hypothetical protein
MSHSLEFLEATEISLGRLLTPTQYSAGMPGFLYGTVLERTTRTRGMEVIGRLNVLGRDSNI